MKLYKVVVNILLIFTSSVYGFKNESAYISKFIDIFRNQKFLSSAKFSDVNPVCAAHVQEVLGSLGELWAQKMVDSIPKGIDGILLGHFQIPGQFDECVDVVTDNFKGQHCMLQVGLGGFPVKISFGICMPSTCSPSDIINILKSIKELEGFDITLNESNCSTNEFRPLRTEDFVTIALFITIIVIAAFSTVYDLMQRIKYKNEKPNLLWSSFSLYTNSIQLFRISQNATNLKCLHGIRFLSICWVILGHTYVMFLFGASINLADLPKFQNDKSFIPISNAFVSVDTFFFLSGLLVCVVFFRDISKKGSFDVPVAFIHRYIRLTPSFAILMLIQATIISRIGNGPFWKVGIDATEKVCRKSWWRGILYVQNYDNFDGMCLGQSWYLSADMQMFWVSPLILYPILLWPSFAPLFIIILILAAASTSFAIAYVNKLAPSMIFVLGSQNMDQFVLEYSPFHTRMAPWLIGLGTGYIICGLQAKKIHLKMTKFWTIVGWLIATGLSLGSLFGIARFISKDYAPIEASLYLSYHRVGWALSLSWIVIACVAGYGGPINYLLSLDFFQPLAKLSYCNFLIHMTIQQYRICTARTNLYIRHLDAVNAFFGDLVMSSFISVPIVLLFEFPFVNIDRHFFQKLVIFPFPKPKKINCSTKSKDLQVEITSGKANLAFQDT